jgi:hypothetical protein
MYPLFKEDVNEIKVGRPLLKKNENVFVDLYSSKKGDFKADLNTYGCKFRFDMNAHKLALKERLSDIPYFDTMFQQKIQVKFDVKLLGIPQDHLV